MLKVVNSTDGLKLRQAEEPQSNEGQIVNVPSFRRNNYERTETQDNFNGKTENHTARNIGIGGAIATLLVTLIYARVHGGTIMEKAGKKDVGFRKKFETGFKNLFKKSDDTDIVKKFKEQEKKAKEEAERLKAEAEKLKKSEQQYEEYLKNEEQEFERIKQSNIKNDEWAKKQHEQKEQEYSDWWNRELDYEEYLKNEEDKIKREFERIKQSNERNEEWIKQQRQEYQDFWTHSLNIKEMNCSEDIKKYLRELMSSKKEKLRIIEERNIPELLNAEGKEFSVDDIDDLARMSDERWENALKRKLFSLKNAENKAFSASNISTWLATLSDNEWKNLEKRKLLELKNSHGEAFEAIDIFQLAKMSDKEWKIAQKRGLFSKKLYGKGVTTRRTDDGGIFRPALSGSDITTLVTYSDKEFAEIIRDRYRTEPILYIEKIKSK